jgi:ABC-type amino acid transport substrate-binding protein
VKLEIQFESLLAAVSSLKTAEKHRLLEMLEDELFDDDDLENDPETMADIEAARADCAAGDYITFEEYLAERRAPAL